MSLINEFDDNIDLPNIYESSIEISNRMNGKEAKTIDEHEHRKMATNLDKFRLLMWKNFLLQRRHSIQTIVEILIPVTFGIILIWIRSMIYPIVYTDPLIFKPFEINTLEPLR